MRIAIIDPYFAVGLGYQATGWFNAFVGGGYRVRAFCSGHVHWATRPLYDRPFPPGLSNVDGGEVLRLPVRLLPRDIAVCTGLLKEVLEFSPDMTVAVYPGTMFASQIIRHRDALPGSLFCTFADNRAQRRVAASGLRPAIKRGLLDVSFHLLKRRYYGGRWRSAMRSSSRHRTPPTSSSRESPAVANASG